MMGGSSAQDRARATIDLRTGPLPSESCCFLVHDALQSVSPNQDQATMRLMLPNWCQGVYFAPCQKYDPMGRPGLDCWPDGLNRMQGLPLKSGDPIRDGGMLLLLKCDHGQHLALLAMVSGNAVACFASGQADCPDMTISTMSSEALADDAPLLAVGVGASPIEACRHAWQAGMKILEPFGGARPREAKSYPEIFEYLGWCSWEHFRQDINGDSLAEAMATLDAHPLPIRSVLIDDGHLCVEASDEGPHGSRLIDWGPDRAKFPDGWQPVLSHRNREKLRWFGLWLNFNGYWSGVSPKHRMDELADHLVPIATGALQPGPAPEDAEAFYGQMISAATDPGFDFVKVDNQAASLKLLRGQKAAVCRSVQHACALEHVTHQRHVPLINCMAHSVVHLAFGQHSAVFRCSEDYRYGHRERGRRHLHNSFENMLWIEPLFWGDHDMFHSTDPLGDVMAHSKALSGGPVFLSDAPQDLCEERVWPLCLDDGRLLRPLMPAMPLAESVYSNPFVDEMAYRVAAPLANGAVAVGAYNLTDGERPVTAHFEPAQWAEARSWLSADQRHPVDQEMAGSCVLFDVIGKKLYRQWPVDIELTNLEEDFLGVAVPFVQGWAVLGMVDKYLPPAAVVVENCEPDQLILTAACSGPLGLVREDERPLRVSESLSVEGGDNHITYVHIPQYLVGKPIKISI